MSRCTGRAALSHDQIAGCFNRGMGRRFRVRLIGGNEEPFYQPASSACQSGSDGCESPLPGHWDTIRYTRDYAASALHELAHWCVAGRERRRRPDYGYWYRPPPRSPQDQRWFMRAELEVQALESCLAAVCGLPFRVSLDDPDICPVLAGEFARSVERRASLLAAAGLPPRARRLAAELGALRSRL